MEICSKCGKPNKIFVKGICRKCYRALPENKAKENAYAKEWYLLHRESEIRKNKEYRKQNRELFTWYHNKDRFNGLREAVLKRDENMCLCGSKYQLSIHHIDGTGIYSVEKYNTNNDMENLILLCNSCHHKLHHYQKRNKILFLTRKKIAWTFYKWHP